MRIAALGGIRHGQQKAFVTARDVLQTRGAVGWKAQGLSRQVHGVGVVLGAREGFDQAFLVEQVDDAGY